MQSWRDPGAKGTLEQKLGVAMCVLQKRAPPEPVCRGRQGLLLRTATGGCVVWKYRVWKKSALGKRRIRTHATAVAQNVRDSLALIIAL